ncbi:hypothetical protein cyc_04494 [Cyclospora cayetanensis]|uniref:Uncharacterized protein n=1 Tax=Cyclospora cayetanensis TaxID=88456 RepID=A0A1D3D2P2_9EIME|nr:hypothetical protein cyc_04494 [Cyclospora cayetanensis]
MQGTDWTRQRRKERDTLEPTQKYLQGLGRGTTQHRSSTASLMAGADCEMRQRAERLVGRESELQLGITVSVPNLDYSTE